MKEILKIITVLSLPVSWLVSLIYCVANQEWLAALVMHVFLFPIGIVHGFFVMFGASWF